MKKLLVSLVAYFKHRKEWWSLWFAHKRLKRCLHREMKTGISIDRFGKLMDLNIRAGYQLQVTNH